MDVSLAIETLKEILHASGAFQVTTFECYRELPGGGAQRIIVEVFDAGRGARSGERYSCRAHTEDGKSQALGSPADSIETALAAVHWFDLDK